MWYGLAVTRGAVAWCDGILLCRVVCSGVCLLLALGRLFGFQMFDYETPPDGWFGLMGVILYVRVLIVV